jgi:hypothetical protein
MSNTADEKEWEKWEKELPPTCVLPFWCLPYKMHWLLGPLEQRRFYPKVGQLGKNLIVLWKDLSLAEKRIIATRLIKEFHNNASWKRMLDLILEKERSNSFVEAELVP